jgi:cytochrome b
MNEPAANSVSMRVWDVPTRLFHWTLTLLIALQYATGEYHVLDMRWHYWFGYATLALIVFRVLWGFAGSQTSRFADFVRGPGSVVRYVKSELSTNPQRSIGHNPLGGWSVLALLLCVAVQAVSGLFASDEIDNDGPLVARVSGTTVKWMTWLHQWNQNLLLALIGLHVVAVLLYLLRKHENLIMPMFSGRKDMADARSLRFVSSWRALALLALSGVAVAALIWLWG